MGLLQQIRDAAVDDRKSLSSVLRQCLVLSSKLGHEPFRQWVHLELIGYGPRDELPEYRRFGASSLGNFNNGFVQFTNKFIDTSGMPDGLRRFTDEIQFRESVDVLEANQDQNSLRLPWPEAATYHLAKLLDDGFVCTSAWIQIPPGAMKGVLGQVRTRIVEFTLSIEADFPRIEDTPTGQPPVPTAELDRRFGVLIMGQGHAISLGQGSINLQNVEQQVIAQNLDSLKAFLQAEGIADDDLPGLEAALRESPDSEELKQGKGRLARWTDDAAGNVVRGAGGAIRDAAKSVITEALLAYLRLS